VLTATGEVVVVDESQLAHVIWPAAVDGGHLLEALLIAADFLKRRAMDEVDYEDFAAAGAAAERCADAAGGERYLDFYRMLLGADP
jgi:hypothetical protein